ncbi:Mu-like prophage tail protein gpP [Duganella sp. CF458]|uniref:phage baseplate assembly protein n=1 Tax=Duganella sp. CF458 TaxID=1884368 RepID=UPI0008DEE2BE|nr:contractile injection system protein, VgrG/Pvc8 family [Duganella sp. CF458]SFG29492.1 Mu-like prophage tail protein gpP [Duganella sp. CF458]
MEDRNKLTLHVGGRVYGGWKSVSVRHGIEQIAGTFDIALTERWPGQLTEWAIPAGEFCEVRIGNHVVINGFVDAVNVSYDANDHRIQVKGRDRTGDLVDCSAPSQAFSGLTFKQIADRLCSPFSVKVYDETTSTKKLTVQQKKIGKQGTPPNSVRVEGCLPKCACQNGESVFRTLERIARNEGVLLVSDHEGGLLLTRAGRAGRIAVPLEFGKNILSANLDVSHANLFSEITVKGQASAQDIDDIGKFESVISSKTTVKRAGGGAKTGSSQIARYRPLIVLCESQADAARIRQRAEWEVGNREAKSRKYVATVQGWYPDQGVDDIWRINSMVRVVDPMSRIDEDWLIAAITFKLDEGGTTAEIELTSPKAFDQLPEIPQPQAGATESTGKFERV